MNEIEKMFNRVGLLGIAEQNPLTSEIIGCKPIPFTAEKQLELLKLLIRHYKTEIYCRYANDKYKLIIYTEDCCTYDMDSFENALASVVCDIWGLLTEEEKQQIKEILK